METVGPPPAEAELHLLTEWSDPAGRTRRREAGIVSVVIHAAVILLIVFLPQEIFQTPPPPLETHHITPLIVVTQKIPNPTKASKEFDGSEARPRPRIQAPPSPPPAPKREAPKMAVATPTAPTPTPRTAPPPPEPLKVEPAKEPPKDPKPDLPQLPATTTPIPPQPQIEAEERPKSPFERPGTPLPPVPAPQRRIPLPDPAAVIRGGVPGGVSGSGGVTLPSTQAGPGGDLELPQLLSDVQGVDFRPYLTRLLFTVKRNWMSVWPESARSGRRGKVGVQFSIGRDGRVQKVVFAYQSGADALDRTAIAAISMSAPFPPLPAEFKGDRIVLQFNFSYNMPKQ